MRTSLKEGRTWFFLMYAKDLLDLSCDCWEVSVGEVIGYHFTVLTDEEFSKVPGDFTNGSGGVVIKR